jgi:hypothetical protein
MSRGPARRPHGHATFPEPVGFGGKTGGLHVPAAPLDQVLTEPTGRPGDVLHSDSLVHSQTDRHLPTKIAICTRGGRGCGRECLLVWLSRRERRSQRANFPPHQSVLDGARSAHHGVGEPEGGAASLPSVVCSSPS